MTYQDYELQVAKMKQKYPEWRLGQTYFNVLADSPNRRLAEKIRGDAGSGGLDPFYNDDRLPAFKAFIVKEWEE